MPGVEVGCRLLAGAEHHQVQAEAPGEQTAVHLHAGHETALYVLSGRAETWYGPGLREHLLAQAGDFLYIPAGQPHLARNPSRTEPCRAVVARTDPDEQESIVLLPELEGAMQAA